MRNKKTYSRFIQNVLPWENFSKGKMIQLLHHSVEHDITSFDNSDFQGRNYVGKTFGTALSESGLSRDEIQLISKYGSSETAGEKLIDTVDEILFTLDTDYLDLLLLDYPHLIPETKDAVEQLHSQGKVLEIGGLNLKNSQTKVFELPMAVNLTASPFSSPEALTQIPAIEEVAEDIVHFVWHNEEPSLSEGSIISFDEICRKYNISRKELFQRWLLQHPAHLHLVISDAEKEEISSAVASKEKQLEALDWKKISLILS